MSPPHVIVSVLASAELVSQKKERKTVAMVSASLMLPLAVESIAWESGVKEKHAALLS